MVLKFILVIFATVFATATCQNISCSYGYDGNYYTCFMTINNPNGYDSFVYIEGTHIDNKSDIDVKTVEVVSGTTTIIPQIFCNQFPNLTYIHVRNNRLKFITDTSFASCIHLDTLYVFNNPIEEFHPNAFRSNPLLNFFQASHTQLTTLPENLFDYNPNLEMFYFYANRKLNYLPANILSSNPNLRDLVLSGNNLTAWNPAWTQSPHFTRISIDNNNLKEIPRNAFNSTKLRNLYLSVSELSILNSTSLGDLSSLELLDIGSNQIHAIDEHIFTQATKLKTVWADGNLCVNETIYNFSVNRDESMKRLQACFDNFEELRPTTTTTFEDSTTTTSEDSTSTTSSEDQTTTRTSEETSTESSTTSDHEKVIITCREKLSKALNTNFKNSKPQSSCEVPASPSPFKISLGESRTRVEISIESVVDEDMLLIYFPSSFDPFHEHFNDESLTCVEIDFSSLPIIINDLTPSVPYLFCVLYSDPQVISPYQCQSFMVEKGTPWILEKDQMLVIYSVVGAFLVAFLIGVAIAYLIVFQFPTLLRGSLKVIIVQDLNREEREQPDVPDPPIYLTPLPRIPREQQPVVRSASDSTWRHYASASDYHYPNRLSYDITYDNNYARSYIIPLDPYESVEALKDSDRLVAPAKPPRAQHNQSSYGQESPFNRNRNSENELSKENLYNVVV